MKYEALPPSRRIASRGLNTTATSLPDPAGGSPAFASAARESSIARNTAGSSKACGRCPDWVIGSLSWMPPPSKYGLNQLRRMHISVSSAVSVHSARPSFWLASQPRMWWKRLSSSRSASLP